MSGYHVIVEADDDRDDSKASEVMKMLCDAYPGHPWHVRIGRGVIIIKHLKLSTQFGMCRHYDRVTFDAGVLKRDIIGAAGEFLERAGLTRGRAKEGDYAKSVDGVPEKRLLPMVSRVLH